MTQQHVEDWIKYLREVATAGKGHRKGQRLSDPTIAAEFAHFRTLCNLAVERKWITTASPCALIKVVDKTRKQRKRRSYTDAEARVVLEWARRQSKAYLRWLPWVCCFTGCRLDEIAGAMVNDVEQVGPYWVLSIRLDHRGNDASLKTVESERRVPLHQALIEEGFIRYVQSLQSPDGSLFPELHADRFGSKGAIATKRLGPHIRSLKAAMPSLADLRLSPSHSWRHRLHDEFRRLKERQDIEDAIVGHASNGSGPGYGEYAIIDMLGPAIDRTRSPFASATTSAEGAPDYATVG